MTRPIAIRRKKAIRDTARTASRTSGTSAARSEVPERRPQGRFHQKKQEKLQVPLGYAALQLKRKRS